MKNLKFILPSIRNMAIIAVTFFISFNAMSNVPSSMIYNVRDYGAKGDGVTLDSPSINKAIEAAAAAGGGEVYIPFGIRSHIVNSHAVMTEIMGQLGGKMI